MDNLKTFEEYGGGYKYRERIPGAEDFKDMHTGMFKSKILSWIPPKTRIAYSDPESKISTKKIELIKKYGFEGDRNLSSETISDLYKKSLKIENGTLVLKFGEEDL